jgi:4-hydroxy-2-oxoglutarate aldolase
MIDGVFPPIPTPFSNDTVDVVAMGSNVDRWMQTRIRGVVVLGSNGEAPFLNESDSDAAVAAAREHVSSNRLCIAGVGRESTIETIRATKRAAGLGVDAVLVRTPSFFKALLTPEVFVAHYTAVADASPVPVVLYNFTAVTGVTLPVDAVSTLAAHPNIVGIKESGSDLKYVSALIANTPDDFVLLAGSAPVFYPCLLVGATGGVLALASVVPDLCVELYDLTQSGRHSEARELQRRLTPLAGLVTSRYGVPGLKAALSLLGFRVGEPRLPLQPIKSEGIDEIRVVLERLGMLSATHSSV